MRLEEISDLWIVEKKKTNSTLKCANVHLCGELNAYNLRYEQTWHGLIIKIDRPAISASAKNYQQI